MPRLTVTTMDNTLTRFAAEQQQEFNAATLPDSRRERGHFGTPPVIADFMAGMFRPIRGRPMRILDPGAGVGTLSAALCERVVRQTEKSHLNFELYENDPRLIRQLECTMKQCRARLTAAGHEMSFAIRVEDFILANTERSLYGERPGPSFDLAIMNPPYFKLQKDSVHARAMSHVVHGQPNIYALFMALVADLLKESGEMVAITPRSYFNGPYFRRFRRWFFDRMTAKQIHLFESRDSAFQDDDVLQENVILLAEKGAPHRQVFVSTSRGRDLENVTRRSLSYRSVLEDSTGDQLVRIATNDLEQEITSAVDRLPQRFRDLPFRISTGPVVVFRSLEFLRDTKSADTCPLLWMHNVRPFATVALAKSGKPAHIVATDKSHRLLVTARRFVLLKRFTAKEERRRLVAGIFEAKDSYSDRLGLENHLNYIYHPRSSLSKYEALGMASYFNSAVIDRYFRAISGNTQVNASEIRAMPIPSRDAIEQIGRDVSDAGSTSTTVIERIVGAAIGLSENVTLELDEACT